jgi:hypothetical protein
MEAVWKSSINSNFRRSHGFQCLSCFMHLKLQIRVIGVTHGQSHKSSG